MCGTTKVAPCYKANSKFHRGPKPSSFGHLHVRAKQAAEKLGISGEIGGKCPSAAKAGIHSVGIMRGLKPPPPSVSSFSAACKAHADFRGPNVRAKARTLRRTSFSAANRAAPFQSNPATAKPIAYRSISPSTMSIDPITATTSASMRPLHITSSACNVANDG
jgi:hypothetical protein